MSNIKKMNVVRLSEDEVKMLEVVFQLAIAAAMEAKDPVYMAGVVSVLRERVNKQLKGKKK